MSAITRPTPGGRLRAVAGAARQALSPNSQTASRVAPSFQKPVSQQQNGNFQTEATTFTTVAGKISEVFSAVQAWSRVTFTLETAGPVEVSASQTWKLGAGQGQTLITNQPVPFNIAKGNKLYIQSGAVNRVRVTIEPIPWLEQITGSVMAGTAAIATAVGQIPAALVAALRAARGQ